MNTLNFFRKKKDQNNFGVMHILILKRFEELIIILYFCVL